MWWLWMLLGLVVLAILLLILIVGLPPKPVNIGEDIPPCNLPLDKLPDVSTSQFISCLTLENKSDPQRFYDVLNDWTILPLDPQIIPSAQQICIQYCPQVQLPNICLAEDEEYLSCLNKLAPVGCSYPAYPVARNGSQEYYAIGKGKVSCY